MSVPLAALRRVTRAPRPAPPGERCEMCAEPVPAAHQHVVDLAGRGLMCACRPCYLLFADAGADLRYRSVPDRYLSFGAAVDGRTWDELQIPVGVAFLFRNSVQDRVVALYPGPAGVTEAGLPLPAWDRIVAADPRLAVLRPDVEALLIDRAAGSCHLVPIDACYEVAGRLRTVWRGFDGGREAREVLDAVKARAA